jgi:iron complex transport system permease protein
VVGPCGLLFLIVLAATPWIGVVGITPGRVWEGISPDREIFLITRLPRVLFGALAGGSLAVAGVLFQAILRNSLAEPFTLGISTGSSFGAVLTIWMGLNVVWLGVPIISVAAFAGAASAMFLVFFVARTRNVLPTFTLLLAGVTLNFVFGALIVLLHYLANFSQSYEMVQWMMGGLEAADTRTLTGTAPFVFLAIAALVWISPRLNPLSAGEEWALTRGVDVNRLKTIAYFAGSLLTGAVTAFCGPIGFVGLIVPHTLRMVIGPDHRTLIPASFFIGAVFLIVCDTAARTVLAPAEIPVGVITALLGGPFFILLLKKNSSTLW